MPSPVHVICIAPVALISAVQAATAVGGSTGILCTSPLYTGTDLPTRPVTHRACSGPVNADQRALLDAAKDVDGNIVATNIDPSFVGVRFVDWLKDPYMNLREELGLVQSATL